MMMIGGKPVGVEVITIKRGTPERGAFTKPRLRFDRVALRLIGDLQAALSGSVPDGAALVVTVTAPIRLASKTATVLKSKVGEDLARRPARVEIKDTIHGNQVRARLVKGTSGRTSKVIGFVHNPDPGADRCAPAVGSVIDSTHRRCRRRAPAQEFQGRSMAGRRHPGGPSIIETYRRVYPSCASRPASRRF